jgi:hypothetical protein
VAQILERNLPNADLADFFERSHHRRMGKSRVVAGAKKAAVRQLSVIEAKITEQLRRNERGAWQVGKLIDQIATTALHIDAGYASLDIYLDQRFPQGYSTLRRYRRIAGTFDEPTVVKHGTSKLEAGLIYLEAAAPKDTDPRTLLSLDIKVPGDGAKRVTTLIPFSKATNAEIQRAIAAARAEPENAADPQHRLAREWQIALQAAVAAPPGTFRHAPLVRVKPHPDKEGAARVDVIGIDLDDLTRVGKALHGVDTSTPTAPPKKPTVPYPLPRSPRIAGHRTRSTLI